MARNFFGIEKGLDIYGENNGLLVRILSGTAAPDGLGDQSSAPIGSLYARSGTGELYQKIANAGNSSDWQLNGSSAAVIGNWRPERVIALTGENVGAGVRDMVANPFTDDDGTAVGISEFIVGRYVISDAAGTPKLLEITNVSGNNVTFALSANVLVEDDAFLIKFYLPDSPDSQEKQAIAVFSDGVMVKVSDVNWNIADGINLAAGYAATNGSISNADTVNSAIQKLDGNQQDIQTTLGVAQGSVDMGTFTSSASLLFAASQTIKQLFQRVGDLLAQLRGVEVSAITTVTTVDSVPHATVKACKWFVIAVEDATPANRKAVEVYAVTNGTLVDDTVSAVLRVGSNFNLSITVDISGADMRLRAASTTAGVTVTARRVEVIKSVL